VGFDALRKGLGGRRCDEIGDGRRRGIVTQRAADNLLHHAVVQVDAGAEAHGADEPGALEERCRGALSI